jgi:dsDNA-binding SOS-regulon protein
MATQIQLRRDTAANWTSNNPTLASGEFGWESDTNRFKIGTGSAAWTALAYASEGDTAGITFVGDDSTGTTVSQNETFKIAGTQNITAVVSGDTLTLTGPDLSSYLTAVAESDVTQHQSALSITESQISDLQSYKTVVSESDVTQHQAALSITESQISDLAHFSGAYADLTGKPTIPTNNTELANGAGYITGYTVTESDVTAQQAALSITESQISDLGTYLTAETNDLSSAVTWANVPNANITEGSVTQHQAALSITESQISDLGAYITGVAFADVTAKPTTVAGYGITDAASTAQGNLADSALQSGDNISELVNNSAFITASALTGLASETYVGTQISNLVDTAPETLNTLNELAAALGDDANFATTTATALGNKANTADLAAVATSGSYTDLSNKPTIPADVSNLTDTTNLLDHFSGAYADLSGKPTIPTNNTELSNGAGYITGYTVSEADVTGHQAALSITESQVSDLGAYITASSTDALTNKTGAISQWTNDSAYLTSFTETNDLSSAVTWANVPDVNITQGSVTQHQAALSITESQISDLGTYLTAETNDLSAAVTWANVPNANITESSVTQHQAALSITESQISDLAHFSGSYTDLTNKPTIPTNNNQLSNGAGYITDYTVTEGDVTAHQAALSITKSQVSDFGTYLTAESNDLSSAVTWANVPDVNITQSSVTQHQAALSVTESQISDLGTYLTAEANDLTSAVTWANVPNANITESSVTQHQAALSITESQISDLSHFSGSYTDLTNKPTIPTDLTDLSITDGSNGQVLTTDGAGGFTFTTVAGGGTTLPSQTGNSGKYLTTDGTDLSWGTVAGGGGSTGDFVFTGNNISTGSSNADAEIEASGTGRIILQKGEFDNFSTETRYKGVINYAEDLTHDAGSDRFIGVVNGTNIKLDGTDSSSSNARFYNQNTVKLDLNGADLTSTSGHLSRGPRNFNDTIVGNSHATDSASVKTASGLQGYFEIGDTFPLTSSLTVDSGAAVVASNTIRNSNTAGITATLNNYYGVYSMAAQTGNESNSGTLAITNDTGFYHYVNTYARENNPQQPTNTYAFATNYNKARSKPGALEQFSEYGSTSTHSSSGTYTVDANNNLQIVTLGANITSFTMSNFIADAKYSHGVTLYLVQDGTGGRTVSFTAGASETFKFANGGTTSTVTAANDIQVVYIFSKYNGTSLTYYWTLGPAYS